MTSTEITYHKYEYPRNNTTLNKRIISLANRNNFYTKQIRGLFSSGSFSISHAPNEIVVAKKGKDKIVGFIVFWGTMTGPRGDRMCMDLKYWLVGKEFRGNNIGTSLYDIMEFTAVECGIDNYSVMYKKDDEFLEKLYGDKGYKFIPIYDGVDTQKCLGRGERSHIRVFNIDATSTRITLSKSPIKGDIGLFWIKNSYNSV